MRFYKQHTTNKIKDKTHGFPGGVNGRKYLLVLIFIFATGFFLYFPAFSMAKEPPNLNIAMSDETESDHKASDKAKEPSEIFTLERTIENAIKANIRLKASREGTKAALFAKKKQGTYFFPSLNTTYQYKHNDEESRLELPPPFQSSVTNPQDEYAFAVSVTQPIFIGFSLLNLYKIADLGLDVSEINEKLIRQEVIFEANKVFFMLLKAQKLLSISKEAVKQLEAHKDVANNFYQVGMTPLNDLLKAQVELANTKQDYISAQNSLDITKSNFNTLLRRPINSPVEIKDILDYSPFEKSSAYCLEAAKKNRLEIKIADIEIKIAEKKLEFEKKDYYPSISLKGNYYRLGTDWDVDGGEGVNDPEGWSIAATASWNFWEWGKTRYGVKEKLSRVSRVRYQKAQIFDSIGLEVKHAYLKTKEAEKKITTVEKAIEQAKENFRISKERYKEQVSTSTDVLDAQTLLSRTMTNYYHTLYDYKIAKASLYKAMGLEAME